MTTQNQPPPTLKLNLPLRYLSEEQAAKIMERCDRLNEPGHAINILYTIAVLEHEHLLQFLEVGTKGTPDNRVALGLSDLLYLMECYLPEV